MSTTPALVTRDGGFYTVLRRYDDWGTSSYDLARPPRRFWADQSVVRPAVDVNVDVRHAVAVPTPAELLGQLPPDDHWLAQTRRSLQRLWAYFLVCEDPQRRMDARPVATLSHQVSLVQHILRNDHLHRVLVADEVGLGKTVEVGLLLAELFETHPALRVLYLAPARLVDNVAREFDRLRLGFRRWKAAENDARLSDPRVIGSIHRAVHGTRFDELLAAAPWDVLIVDECHHLSDWAAGGGSPGEKYRLVKALAEKQPPGSRLVLLSGTPHQGHMARFENLLRLLQWPREQQADLRGRVIYRTKDDIRDWRGVPVFPSRQINEPMILNLGTLYRAWLENIHRFYRSGSGSPVSQTRQRAAGWRAAQALQWAASSPQAGLGYLVRQAIRADWTLEHPELAAALTALRPYRNGSADEALPALFGRLGGEIQRQANAGDIEDIEDDADGELQTGERVAMAALLNEGAEVVRQAGDEKWRILKERVLDAAGDDKIVLFAQPIETVIALARWLERTTGERPAIIIGGQNDWQRQQEENRFRQAGGPRYLVSSRAGGEGINLQVACRLVHVDVPWNPMELEQRVGRVHRFGSHRTIIVDTLVVGESREAEAYRIARRKLRTIAATLRPEQFELIFSRVMSLVPPEELQAVLLEEPAATFSAPDTARLSAMVESGYHAWKTFHEQFHAQQRQIRQLDGGLATWEDLEAYLVTYACAEIVGPAPNARGETLSVRPAAAEGEDVQLLRLADAAVYAAGDTRSGPISGPANAEVRSLGLNAAPVAAALRAGGFPKQPAGAANVRLGPGGWRPVGGQFPAGILVLLVQVVQVAQHESWQEHSAHLAAFQVDAAGATRVIEGEEKGDLCRTLFVANLRAKPPVDTGLITALASAEEQLLTELRRTPEVLLSIRARCVVTPLLAAVIDD